MDITILTRKHRVKVMCEMLVWLQKHINNAVTLFPKGVHYLDLSLKDIVECLFPNLDNTHIIMMWLIMRKFRVKKWLPFKQGFPL